MSLVDLAPQEALKVCFGFDEFKGEYEPWKAETYLPLDGVFTDAKKRKKSEDSFEEDYCIKSLQGSEDENAG